MDISRIRKLLLLIALTIVFWSCQTKIESNEASQYLRWVGDIEQNDNLDDPNFKVCYGDDNVLQYFNLSKGPVYKGEKSQVLNTFKSKYKPISDSDESGFIRIRFIVNCEGKAGRFRVLHSDVNYQETEFDQRMVSQLLDITKGIEDWHIFYREDTSVDYYMYLIFKIKEGQLIDILP